MYNGIHFLFRCRNKEILENHDGLPSSRETRKTRKMSDFFEARIDGYEEHMLDTVKGCKEGYQILAELVPVQTKKIIGLGCGPGLELDEIFIRFPQMSV